MSHRIKTEPGADGEIIVIIPLSTHRRILSAIETAERQRQPQRAARAWMSIHGWLMGAIEEKLAEHPVTPVTLAKSK